MVAWMIIRQFRKIHILLPFLQDAAIRLVVIGQAAHHHIEVIHSVISCIFTVCHTHVSCHIDFVCNLSSRSVY